MSEAWILALGAVIAAVISGTFGYFIKRSADKATRATAEAERDTSLHAIEARAFKRAEEIYVNALDIAKRENADRLSAMADLQEKVARLEGELEAERKERRAAVTQAHKEIQDMRVDMAEKEATIQQLKRIIAKQERGQMPAGIDLDQPPDLPGPSPPSQE